MGRDGGGRGEECVCGESVPPGRAVVAGQLQELGGKRPPGGSVGDLWAEAERSVPGEQVVCICICFGFLSIKIFFTDFLFFLL